MEQRVEILTQKHLYSTKEITKQSFILYTITLQLPCANSSHHQMSGYHSGDHSQ